MSGDWLRELIPIQVWVRVRAGDSCEAVSEWLAGKGFAVGPGEVADIFAAYEPQPADVVAALVAPYQRKREQRDGRGES